MRIIVAVCISIFAAIPCYVLGEDDLCSDLLRHGIYDHFRETGDSSSYSRTQKELCESYSELQKDIKNGNVKASYKLFSGQASFSKEHIESIAKQMCNSDFSESSAKNMIEKASSMINLEAIQAYRECMANKNVGLKSKTEYTQDDIGVKNIILTVYYAPDKRIKETPKFTRITMSPKDSFECSGDLCDYEEGEDILTSAHTTTFIRKIAQSPFEEQGRKLYASAGSITVSTSAGAITRQVTPIYAPPPAEIERRLTETEKKLEVLQNVWKKTLTGMLNKNMKQSDWTLNVGSGTRETFAYIKFEESFQNIPHVTVGLSFIDAGIGTGVNVRCAVYTKDITRDGFRLVFQTWDDSKVYALTASWIAVGK